MRVSVEADPTGQRAAVELVPDLLAGRVLDCDGAGARVALVATGALLLGGDVVNLSIRVGEGARLEIVEVAGVVAFDSSHEEAGWHVDIEVGAAGLLVWHGEPFVVAAGALVRRTTTARLGARAGLCMRETVVLGRHGEVGGDLYSATDISVDGRPVLVEELDLSESARTAPGVLGTARVLDTLLMMGGSWPVDGADPEVYELAHPAIMARHMGEELHRSPIPLHWNGAVSAASQAWVRRAAESPPASSVRLEESGVSA